MKEFEKTPYPVWLEAVQKWTAVVEKTKAGEVFSNSSGFRGLTVWDKCSYCEYFERCDSCPLCRRKVNNSSICRGLLREISFAGFFVGMMRNPRPDFEEALFYAQTVLKAIVEDCPDKKQAEKDGVVFEE